MVMEGTVGCGVRCLHHCTSSFSIFTVLVLQALLLAAVDANILVVDIETNETSPIFNDDTATFGPPVPHYGVSGRVMYSEPADACQPVQLPPGPTQENIGWVLVISRGGKCQFADKVLAAQQKGYDAAVIHNYKGHEELVKMYGNDNATFINIPSTFVGWNEGMRLKNEYNYTYKQYYIKILGGDDLNFKLYLWPFVIVVAVCFVLVMVFVAVKFVREQASRRVNRLSSKHLKKIPVRKFKKGDYYDTCAICLDEYEEGEKIRVLPCDHVYHTKCIDPWLTKNKKTCPVCKRRVIPGRDADSDSESERGDGDGTINSSERTPLLGESSRGSSPAAERPQYSSQSLHTAVVVAQTRGTSRQSEVGALVDLDSAQGAVGGTGISDRFEVPGEGGETKQHSSFSSKDKRKRRGERRDAGERDGLREVSEETREERRERRRKKKDKKRRTEELARQAMVAAAEEAESNWRREGLTVPLRDVTVEVAGEEVSRLPWPEGYPDESLHSGRPVTVGRRSEKEEDQEDKDDGEDQFYLASDGASDGQETPLEESEDQAGGRREREECSATEVAANRRAEAYINPSFSESQEVVLPNPSRRHEMNDMV